MSNQELQPEQKIPYEWESIEDYSAWFLGRFNAKDDMGILLSTYSQSSRHYLSEIFEEIVGKDDFSTMPPAYLWAHVEMYDRFSALIASESLILRERKRYDPLKYPLPMPFICWLFKASFDPVNLFIIIMSFIVQGKHAEAELQRRGIEPDQVEADVDKVESVSAVIDYILKSFWKDRLEGRDIDHPDIVLEGTWDWLKWVGKRKPIDVFIDRFEGKLESTWKKTIKRDMIDESRKEKHTAEKEITESQLDAQRKAQGIDTDTPFLDTIAATEPMSEEPIDLKSLVLNIDELKPVELSLLNDVCDATNKDIPLTKYWGEDYTKKIKRLNRLRPKLKKP